jgi:hypothetical protein
MVKKKKRGSSFPLSAHRAAMLWGRNRPGGQPGRGISAAHEGQNPAENRPQNPHPLVDPFPQVPNPLNLLKYKLKHKSPKLRRDYMENMD